MGITLYINYHCMFNNGIKRCIQGAAKQFHDCPIRPPSLVQEVIGNHNQSSLYIGNGIRLELWLHGTWGPDDHWGTGTTMAGSPQPPDHIAVNVTVREPSYSHLGHFEWAFGLNIRPWRFKCGRVGSIFYRVNSSYE
jgi:hypothetical protein